MLAREQLIQEIEHVSESLVEEVLDFLLFIKSRQHQRNPASFNQTNSDQTNQPPQSSVLDRMEDMRPHLRSVGNLSDREPVRALIALRRQENQQQQA